LYLTFNAQEEFASTLKMEAAVSPHIRERQSDCMASQFRREQILYDRLCGLVVRVPGYRSRGPGFDSRVLTDFLRTSGFETGSTQPQEYN
jgi:hypothetical protein